MSHCHLYMCILPHLVEEFNLSLYFSAVTDQRVALAFIFWESVVSFVPLHCFFCTFENDRLGALQCFSFLIDSTAIDVLQ